MNPLPKPVAPSGLQALIDQCESIYPDQLNPLQVTTVLKYWLGGQDPLDYISMYNNPGNPAENIAPHWHYVSFGLSDLHGDNRVHQNSPQAAIDSATGEPFPHPSGMGFELTFRLAKQPAPPVDAKDGAAPTLVDRPPTWPANLLQSLARYVFQTGNRLCAGDNVPWGKSLDQSNGGCIQHMLIAPDAQLTRNQTPFGTVDFCQIIGVTSTELEQASRWNGGGVCNLLRKSPSTGGAWLITDMRRENSVFQLFPNTLEQLERDLECEGSDLAGVNAEFAVRELKKSDIKAEQELGEAIERCGLNEEAGSIAGIEIVQEKSNTSEDQLVDADKQIAKDAANSLQQRPFSAMSDSGSLSNSCPLVEQPLVHSQAVQLEGLQLTLAPNAAKFLLMAIKDRIRHGRHFTFKCDSNRALTFVSASVSGASVTSEAPYCVMGYWTQVLITDDLVPQMIAVFADLAKVQVEDMELPKYYEWPNRRLKIIIDVIPQSPPQTAVQRYNTGAS